MPFSSKTTYHPKSGDRLQWLYLVFHKETIEWLEDKVKDLLMDYLTIQESSKQMGTGDLSDYSFVTTPAFKALEGTLIQIAKELGFEAEKYRFKIGVVFDDKNIELFYEDVIKKIENITNEQKLDIKIWLNDIQKKLKHFRHSPAHFTGEGKSNYAQAFMLGDQILADINELCYVLITSGLLKIPEKNKAVEARKRLAAVSIQSNNGILRTKY